MDGGVGGVTGDPAITTTNIKSVSRAASSIAVSAVREKEKNQ